MPTLNKKWGSTLPALITSIVFAVLFFSPLTSAQAPPEEINIHYRIYPDCENDALERNIIDAIGAIGQEGPKAQQGEILIKTKFLTRASLYDRRGPITEDEEFYEYVKNVAKGKFALTIDPGKMSPELKARRLRFTLRDLDKNVSYPPWEIDWNVNDDEKLRDRLHHISERIQSIIRGGPYKFVFSCCCSYEDERGAKNENIKALTKKFPSVLKDKLKTELIKPNLKPYKIDVEYKPLTLDQCKNVKEQDIENYFGEYDCIVIGKIYTEASIVNIELDYIKSGPGMKSMGDVRGRNTDDLLGMVVKKICENLPKLMWK
jgi:hypothetical protein